MHPAESGIILVSLDVAKTERTYCFYYFIFSGAGTLSRGLVGHIFIYYSNPPLPLFVSICPHLFFFIIIIIFTEDVLIFPPSPPPAPPSINITRCLSASPPFHPPIHISPPFPSPSVLRTPTFSSSPPRSHSITIFLSASLHLHQPHFSPLPSPTLCQRELTFSPLSPPPSL